MSRALDWLRERGRDVLDWYGAPGDRAKRLLIVISVFFLLVIVVQWACR